jgi:hypothetical protein
MPGDVHHSDIRAKIVHRRFVMGHDLSGDYERQHGEQADDHVNAPQHDERADGIKEIG